MDIEELALAETISQKENNQVGKMSLLYWTFLYQTRHLGLSKTVQSHELRID